MAKTRSKVTYSDAMREKAESSGMSLVTVDVPGTCFQGPVSRQKLGVLKDALRQVMARESDKDSMSMTPEFLKELGMYELSWEASSGPVAKMFGMEDVPWTFWLIQDGTCIVRCGATAVGVLGDRGAVHKFLSAFGYGV